MSIEIDKNFTRDIFVKKLKESTEEGRNLIPIVDFIFSDYGSDLFDRINQDFTVSQIILFWVIYFFLKKILFN